MAAPSTEYHKSFDFILISIFIASARMNKTYICIYVIKKKNLISCSVVALCVKTRIEGTGKTVDHSK